MNKDQLFSSMFESFFDCLYNYGMKITRDKELVEDSIQELFFRIWKNNIDLENIKNPKSYLIKGLRHQIYNIISLKGHQSENVRIDETIKIEFSQEDISIQNQNEEEIRNRVLLTLGKLSDRQRETIYLRYFEELSYEEIAEVLNINLQSAKNNVQRGIKSLREYFGSLILFGISF